ncbi:MAG: RdgB/HAM1 family non-canonical purine NTP pyrophosphatase [Lachnospiraceae bacterium]|nr:RdgB/HAM1 family non-canonical purine NTP pyrophosphatase [Lachnospiraceae bacterium]
MSYRIIFATSNEEKMKEIREILGDIGLPVLSQKEAGISADIVEDGDTFEANAMIKARAVHELCGDIVLADDSGLEVDYMDKAPGVFSARYMGEDTSYLIKNQYIIERLEGVTGSDRSARFVCVIGAVFPDGHEASARGAVEGWIAFEPAGENGFGYDPIFLLPDRGVTTAELSPEEKNEISHRGKALRAIRPVIEEWVRTHS